MTDRPKDRGVVYLRRSTTKQESSFEVQLAWARKQAQVHGVALDATDADLKHMLTHGLPQYKDIFLDDGVSGSVLDRPAFTAFREAALRDRRVSHVFTYLSDRLARPEMPTEGMQLEAELQYAGITIVFVNRVAPPRQRGQQYIADDVLSMFEYAQNGDFLNKLSQRVLETQLRNAKQGFCTGGRPPYGFARVLIDAEGKEIRELLPGEVVKMEGCRIVNRPNDPEKIKVWLYILQLKGEQEWGNKRIAQHLNRMKIPSPGGSTWTHQAVSRLCANRAIVGEQEFGRRARGKHRRVGPDGPRPLDDCDFNTDGTVKWLPAPSEQVIRSQSGHEACADPELFEACQKLAAERGASTRGIPRATDPAKYPLSSRIIDATDGCGAPLYGLGEGSRSLYACSRYLKSNGGECRRNTVDGEMTLQFVWQLLLQLVSRCGGRAALREQLRRVFAARQVSSASEQISGHKLLEKQLAKVRKERDLVGTNLARAKDGAVFKSIEAEFKKLERDARELERQLAECGRAANSLASPDEVVDDAMRLLDNLGDFSDDRAARQRLGELLRRLDIRLWLRFQDNPRGKRPKRVLKSGVITAVGNRPDFEYNSSGSGCPPEAGGSDGSVHPGAETLSTTKRQRKSKSITKGTLRVPSLSRQIAMFFTGSVTALGECLLLCTAPVR
ncbi:MAG: recombinase family protein [Pirellulales bacterium]